MAFRNSTIRIEVTGTIAADPELRYTPSGTAVTSLRIPVNRVFKAGEENVEETIWMNATLFGKLAELVCTTLNLTKGTIVQVAGTPPAEIRVWEDSSGNQRASHEMRVDDITVIRFGPRNEDDAAGEPPVEDEIPF